MGLMKDAAMQFAAGGCAGLVEVSLMHPLDLIKTRLQVQTGTQLNRYTGVLDCVQRVYRTEGFASFYKGILPPILAETPKRATKTYSLAGLGSGLTEAIVICPFEVVKVRLQAEQNVTLKQQKSTFQMAREIIRNGGVGTEGIYRGLTSTLGRHGVWNMIYFGMYHSVKQKQPPPQDPTMNFLYRFAIGLVAGTTASVVNIPFDVAKSRIQGPQPIPGSRKYHGCFQTMSLVVKEEGFLALYKGLLPKIMRLGPGGAIMLIVYEHVFEFLKARC